jgi:hypothetical protein
MTNFLNAISDIRHAEERPTGRVSKHARCSLFRRPESDGLARAEAGEEAGDKAASGGAVLLVAAGPEDLVHRTQGEAAAGESLVDRRDPEWQHAMTDRLLDVPDPLAQRGEAGRIWRARRKIGSGHMRKAHPLTCNYRLFAGARMSGWSADLPNPGRCDMPGQTP